MNLSGFSFLITGVLLNAIAQLLLKAGTNTLGVITLTRTNWTGEFGRMATEPHFIGGVICYGFSLIVWILDDPARGSAAQAQAEAHAL